MQKPKYLVIFGTVIVSLFILQCSSDNTHRQSVGTYTESLPNESPPGESVPGESPPGESIPGENVPDNISNVVIDGSVSYQSITGFEVEMLGMLAKPKGFGETLSSLGRQLINDFGFRIIMIREDLSRFEPENDNSDPLTFNWNYYNSIFSQQEFVEWFQTIKSMYDAGAEIHLSTFQPPNWFVVPGPYRSPRKWQLDPNFPRPDLYQEIAELWAALLVHLRDVYGVEVGYCVVWNEPLWGEPLLFTESELVETLKAMGRRFKVEGLNTKILVPEGGNISNTLRGAGAILADPDAAPYAGAITYHTYDKGRVEPDAVVGLLQDLADDTAIAASSLELRMTEWAPTGEDPLNGQALAWAKEIYNCHVFGRTSLVSNWFIGPLVWAGDPTNSIEDDGSGGLRWRKKMYAFKQFSKFIDPGSERIDVSPTVSSGTSVPAVSAYLHPTSKRLTIVAINRSSSSNTINVSLQNLAGYADIEVYRTSATEDTDFIERLGISNDAFLYDLPAESVTTFTTQAFSPG